jgi:hypothetical protein
MFREQGAEENMWIYAVDVAENVFRPTTYTGLLVGLLLLCGKLTGMVILTDFSAS